MIQGLSCLTAVDSLYAGSQGSSARSNLQRRPAPYKPNDMSSECCSCESITINFLDEKSWRQKI